MNDEYELLMTFEGMLVSIPGALLCFFLFASFFAIVKG